MFTVPGRSYLIWSPVIGKKSDEHIVCCQTNSVSASGRPSSHDGGGATALVVGFQVLTAVVVAAAARKAVSPCIAVLFLCKLRSVCHIIHIRAPKILVFCAKDAPVPRLGSHEARNRVILFSGPDKFPVRSGHIGRTLWKNGY